MHIDMAAEIEWRYLPIFVHSDTLIWLQRGGAAYVDGGWQLSISLAVTLSVVANYYCLVWWPITRGFPDQVLPKVHRTLPSCYYDASPSSDIAVLVS